MTVDGWWQLILGGGLFVGFAALLTVFANRKRDVSAYVQAQFAQNVELQEFIDKRVELAAKPLRDRIAELESQLETFGNRDTAVKNILRSFFQRLVFWDSTGRRGDLPMPSAADMEKLDLDLNLEASETLS